MEIRMLELQDNLLQILDQLPLPICILDEFHYILYTNPALKQIFHLDNTDPTTSPVHCSSLFLDVNKTNFCISCSKSARIRKEFIINSKGNLLKFEYNDVPLDDAKFIMRYFLEQEVLYQDTLNYLSNQYEDEFFFTFIRFGMTGAEVVVSELLPFIEEEKQIDFLTIFGAYWMISLGQGDHYNEGFFGPLPVLHYTDYLSYGLSIIMASDNSDERLQGKDYTILLIFARSQLEPMFLNRIEIEKLLRKNFEEFEKAEDISLLDLQVLKTNLKAYFHFLLNEY